jgi:hypothetical protein
MNKKLVKSMLILGMGLQLSACGAEGAGDDPEGAPSNATAQDTWAGKYALTIPPSFWDEPPGIGSDIGVFVPEFLFDVQGSAVTMATMEAGVQQTCTPTLMAQAAIAAPQFVVGPVDYPMHLVNEVNGARVNTTIRSVTFTNVLPPTDAAGGTMSAVLDAREIYPLFHLIPMPTADAVCMGLAEFDVTCEPCPQDGLPFCLTIAANALEAVPAPDQVLTLRDAASLGPECANSIPAP